MLYLRLGVANGGRPIPSGLGRMVHSAIHPSMKFVALRLAKRRKSFHVRTTGVKTGMVWSAPRRTYFLSGV